MLPDAKPYERTGYGAALDSTARLAKALDNPALALVERMAGDKSQVGTFANEHPEATGIIKGLFQ